MITNKLGQFRSELEFKIHLYNKSIELRDWKSARLIAVRMVDLQELIYKEKQNENIDSSINDGNGRSSVESDDLVSQLGCSRWREWPKSV
jgi:hypothetical protein